VKKILIAPASIAPGDTVAATVNVSDPQGEAVEIEYQWYVNGEAVEGARGKDFKASNVAPGDKISLKARGVETTTRLAGDWKESGAVKVNEYPLPKLAGVSITPDPLPVSATAEAVVDYGDVDPNDVEVIYYRWTVNGKVLEGPEFSAPTLDPGNFKTGDGVSVTISLTGKFDGSNQWTSAIYAVVNSPPEFSGTPEAETDGDTVMIYFEAQDPDGDPLSYSVQGGPPGAYVDKTDGTKVVIGAANAAPGTYDVTIIVSDGHGGQIGKTVSVTVPERE
jgi:hypothetical protein